jgi:trans-aconitate methyltransferase
MEYFCLRAVFVSIVIMMEILIGMRRSFMSKDIAPKESWSSGDAYERYVGRWSRIVAQEFIRWLNVQGNHSWLDVGCGTGALSQTILERTNPKNVKGIDRSEAFVETARSHVNHPNIQFETGDAQSLAVESDAYDVAVSGLVLNFVPQPDQMLAEMKRAVRKDGIVALYVWDYAGKMQFLHHFWDAAAALDPAAHDLDEGLRFPICNAESLSGLFQNGGLTMIETRPIDIPTHFKDFDDYWNPFLGGQGPAPVYLASLTEERRIQLRERIRKGLPFDADGSIPLIARAWAVKGIKSK